MEETITIRVYDASTNTYYDKQVPYVPQPLDKSTKYAELEQFTLALQNKGVEYNGVFYKCDEACENNLVQTTLFADTLLANGGITWYTRNGEQGSISITTKEQWLEFMSVLANKIAEIKNTYYAYMYRIDNAKSEEELNAIVFENNDTIVETIDNLE